MEPSPALTIALVLGGYGCGVVPTGVWLTRRAGVDLRHSGSGNVGATNVLRTAGARLGALTLLGDVVKGALPPLVASYLTPTEALVCAAGAAAVVGHCYPVTHRFSGGKGVASALGVLLVVTPVAALAALAVFIPVQRRTGWVSLGSLTATATAPLAAALLGSSAAVVTTTIALAALVWWRHRDNLRRLLAGTEPRTRLPKKQADA